MDIYKLLFNCGVIPVIKLDDANNAVPLMEALCSGGINSAEITFRTDAAEASIREVKKNFPKVLIGAGTVSNVETVKCAVDAGVEFIVSPGFNPKVVEYCVKNKICVIPGISGATDIETAIDYGLSVLKFFPAEANGGLKMLKALSAPYPSLRFMPTGGIDKSNLTEYLMFDKIIACGGSWMVKDELINAKNFAEITRLSREAVALLHGFSFSQLGANQENTNIDLIHILDGLLTQSENDYIKIKSVNVERAIAFFENKGISIDYDTINKKDNKLISVCLKDKIGGLRVLVS